MTIIKCTHAFQDFWNVKHTREKEKLHISVKHVDSLTSYYEL